MSYKDQMVKMIEHMRAADPERLARLEAMGADTSKVMLHGTSDLKREPVFATNPVWSEFQQTQKPTFLSPDPFFVLDYSNPLLPSYTQQRTLPVFAPKGNYFDFENPEHIKDLRWNIYADAPEVGLSTTHDQMSALKSLIAQKTENNWLHLENLKEAIQRAGHPGYYEMERGVKNLAVFDPSNIKSVWAKGKGPGLIGGTAAAAMLATPSESIAQEVNPLNLLGSIVNKYREAQEGMADKIVETVNPYPKQKPDQTTKELGRMIIDPLNLIGGPVGDAVMALDLMTPNKEK